MSLSAVIKDISENWLDYRNHCLDKSKTGASIRKVKKDHKIYNLVTENWKQSVSKNVNQKKYLVDSSIGLGLLSAAPWLTVMDRSVTDTATEGFYVVYLFSRSAKKLYLAIGIGATQFQEIYGMTKLSLEKIDEAAKKFYELFKKYQPSNTKSTIDLLEDDLNFEDPIKGTARNLVAGFEKGTNFIKEYDLKNLNDDELLKDLREYINIYSNIIEDPNAENLDILAETTIDKKIASDQKDISTDYNIPTFKPRDKTSKKTRKISTVVQSKKKRRTQQSKKIGLAGERHVYNYEYDNLIKENRKDLAEKIIKHFENYEYPGWDITSYDKNGNEIFIEVKSTKGNTINQLEITSNEWEAAKKEGEKYFIYLVNNALNEKIKVFEKINNPAKLVDDNSIDISTSVYELKL
jgi:hypothetical protein